MSMHTSAGLPGPIADFLDCLEKELPWTGTDWFVNFQQEGSTAVWAGVEALAHLYAKGPHPKCKNVATRPSTCIVGIGESSYHGPKTTALGQPAQPRWPNAPRTSGQASYPLPPFEAEGAENGRYLEQFDAFLAENPDIGVFVFEPQWGSSRLACTWDPCLLKQVIDKCQQSGAYVLCDEIMCGLGRHGQGTLFLSRAWGLSPDAVTFGKSVSSGTFSLSGVAVGHGSEALREAGARIQQSHTYAASSALAYLTATEILKELPAWYNRAKTLGQMVPELLAPLDEKFFRVCGQGLLWGVELLKKVELTKLEEACYAEGVWPYIVASPLGFMITPPMDIEEVEFRQGVGALRRVLRRLGATD
ncbi:unnamed protein product [Effrenium voratum]|nr:unnamed protein product [Effrenium voratum]